MKKTLLIFVSIVLIVVLSTILFSCVNTVKEQTPNDGYYVLCYFRGEYDGMLEQQSVHLAISSNGYDFTPLNDNEPMIEQTLGKKNCRDPFLFKANDKYYILATDMDSKEGWLSNHSLVMWESTDLITWTNERIFEFHDYEGFENANRVWAPQVVYDSNVGKYMVYLTLSVFTDENGDGEDDDITYIRYGYLNEDFTKIENIKDLFKASDGTPVIDADIVKEGDTYYMYYKYEGNIYCATSKSLTGPYDDSNATKVSHNKKGCEGSFMYKLKGTDTYLMIFDEYGKNKYTMQTTTSSSMMDFSKLSSKCYALSFHPKHANVLEVDENTYNTLKELV